MISLARTARFCFRSGVALAVAAAACDRPAEEGLAGDGAPFTVDDSAGIEIVENHAPEYPPGQFWTIDPEPEIVLGGSGTGGGGRPPGAEAPPGGAAAEDAAQLIWEVIGIARLQDGRVAVLSQGNDQLYLFEPSGELSSTIGRRGEGPGEFTQPEALHYLAPDTLVLWDHWYTATSYFDTGGELLQERRFNIQELMDQVPGANDESGFHPLPDGSFLVVDRPPPGEPRRGSLVRDPAAHYMRVDSTYSVGSLGYWEGWEQWYPEEEWEFGGFPTLMVNTSFAVGGSPLSIYMADAERYEIRQFSLDGEPVRIIRRTAAPVPVTPEAHREWQGFLSRQILFGDIEPHPGKTWEEFFAEVPRREFYPPVAGLFVDTEGYLWVREWSEEAAGGIPDQWSIFGPDGRWLGVVRGVPDYFACRWHMVPCWIDRDVLLTIRLDELGVESVEGYRIRRGDEGP